MRWRPLLIGGLLVSAIGGGYALFVSKHQPSADTNPHAASANAPAAPMIAQQPVLTDDPLPIFAGSGVVIDAETGTELLKKNADQPVPIASTTKVMSSIVFLKTKPYLDQQVTVDSAAASQIGSLMNLASGEKISLRGLLTGALLVSGNDAIYEIAEQTGGVDSFVKEMNQTANEMGLTRSMFLDPAGLNDDGRTSAHDLALMFRYALTFEDFRSVIHQPSADISSSTDTYHLKSSNRLIVGDEPLYLSDTIGGKTGFTPDAGHCLVAAASRNGHVLIAVVLASNDTAPDGSAREARRLLTWTFDHTHWE